MTRRPLRIAVISDAGSDGGAGIAASRLANGLRHRGHTTAMIYRGDFPANPDVADVLLPVRHRWVWWGRLMAIAPVEPVRRAVQRSWVRVLSNALGTFRPDVVSLHNLHRAEWDTEVVGACLRFAPVVWTLHDMWAVTGGCPYALDCRRFMTRCDRRCPQAGIPPVPPARRVGASFTRRRHLFAHTPPLVLVSPSKWLAGEARAAAGVTADVRVIPNGLDLNVFRPLEKSLVRDLLQLDGGDQRPVVATSAVSLEDPRKGLRALLDALREVPEQRIRLLLLGAGGTCDVPPHVAVHRLGPIRGDALLALAYAAADLFVLASAAENQPLVLLESLACEVPVLAAAVGGIPEVVVPGETGWLAARPDGPALAEALRCAFNDRASWGRRGANGRSLVAARHNVEAQAQRYEALFRCLLDGAKLPSQQGLDVLLG